MSDITWKEVESRNIAAIGMSRDKVGELHIRFKPGTEYVYHDVPTQVVVDLLVADSHSKYLNKHIKGEYECEEVQG